MSKRPAADEDINPAVKKQAIEVPTATAAAASSSPPTRKVIRVEFVREEQCEKDISSLQ
jgi:hypothetical protein